MVSQMIAGCHPPSQRPRGARLAARWAAPIAAVLALAGLLAGLMAIASPARAEGARMAMVVGNADYDALPAVPQAARGARDIAETLEAQGFEVSLLLNGDRATFAAALDSFERRAEGAEMVLFYFAGHGLRVDGDNRLAPIDLRPGDAAAGRAGAVALAPLMERLATGTRPAVMVLDASRRLDLAAPLSERVADGLGVPAPAREALVVMATQPGSLTPETGAPGFLRDLRDALAVPGQPLEPVLQDLAATTRRVSDGRQTPWIRSSLSEPLFLNPFRPDETDFARLKAMPPARQDFLLEIWRSQGARIDDATLARRLGRAAPAAEAVALTGPARPEPGQTATDADERRPAPETARDQPPARTSAQTPAAPQFSFEYIEEAAPPAAPAETTPVPAARAPEAAETVTMAALPAPAAGTGAQVADAPISRIRASRAPRVASLVDPDRRLVGEDVTELFMVPDDLPRAVQTELARLGCYRTGIDGIWGGGSRRALRDYIARSGADLDGLAPTEAAWREVKAATGTICPAPAPAPRQARPAPVRTTRTPAPAPEPAPAPAPAPAPSGSDADRLRGALGGAFR